jgi:Ca-activated chloride channel family protein
MAARARMALAVTLLAPVAMAYLNAQSPETLQQTFRSAVDLVTIQASVRDGRGRVVQGLTRADFEVRDNGQLRPVLDFRADRQSPVTVAILVDMSGSMSIGTKVAMARQAYQSVLSQLREQDEVALFTFDSSLRQVQDFTQDLTLLRDALSTFEPFGTTSLYDATAATARRLAERTATHRAIVVLTDGIDTSSRLSAADVSGLASSINVPVYIVATVPSIDQRVMMEATERGTRTDTADLRDLAEWTGGHLVFASTFTETIVVASSIVDELRQQYVLAIEAAPEREWRRLDVRVKNPSPSTTVKARSGYFGG